MATTSDSNTMSAWRAKEVKNWTQALLNLTQALSYSTTAEGQAKAMETLDGVDTEIIKRIHELLGIADDLG